MHDLDELTPEFVSRAGPAYFARQLRAPTWTSGQPTDLSLVGARWLAAGLDTEELRALATLRPDQGEEAVELLPAVLTSLGLPADPVDWRREELERLQRALAVVDRDVRACLSDPPGLRIAAVEAWEWDEAGHVVPRLTVTLDDGSYRSSGASGRGTDDRIALATVAASTYDCIVEVLRRMWPDCHRHGFGMHLDTSGPVPVWSCTGGHRHPVGALDDSPAAIPR